MLSELNSIIFRQIFLKSFLIVFTHKSKVFIKGPLGILSADIPPKVLVQQEGSIFKISGTHENKALILTFFKLINQKLRGVSLGFFEVLIISGVGWRLAVKTSVLTFSIGYSHAVHYKLKDGIEVILLDKQKFKIFGLDLALVQQTVAELCNLRPLDVYKGKGLYRQNRIFRLKISAKSKA